MTRRVALVYWGRRGAIARLALDLVRALIGMRSVRGFLSVSTDNELIAELQASSADLLPVPTFASALGILRIDRLLSAKRALVEAIERERIDTVVVLMSHLWTPLVTRAIRRTGARLIVIVHDAEGHPGDLTGVVTDWLLVDARRADEVVTLSEHVARRLENRRIVPAERLRVLPLPVFDYAVPLRAQQNAAFGLLFFGRILAYKGLGLMVEAAEILKRRGLALRWGVAGAGELGPLRARLEALGAEVINRWIDDKEVGAILARYDAMVLPYVEASQSGVAAAALGAGLPMVATPVGGLVEQVEEGRTGLLAERVDAAALADAIERLARDPPLQERLRAGVAAARAQAGPERFLGALLGLAGPET